MYEFPIQRAAQLKEKPDPKTLIFGRTFTDHMFLMNYDAGRGWHDGRIVPYAPLELAPSAMVFHYAQEVFEGLKAYRAPDGGVQLFRPADNGQRLADSCERLCIPPVPVDEFVAAVEALVRVEADWVPSEPGTSPVYPPLHHRHRPQPGRPCQPQLSLLHHLLPGGRLLCRGHQPRADLCGERGRARRPGRHRLYQVRRATTPPPSAPASGPRRRAMPRSSGWTAWSASILKRSAP